MARDKFFAATAIPDRTWWRVLWPDPESVLRTLGIAPGMTVLDLCCGDGVFTAPLARIVDGEVYALDIDPEMLDQARAEASRQGVSVARWICGDARDLETLLPEAVDVVLIANTFHGVPDKAGLARAVARVLKPQGRFAVVNWHRIPREETTVRAEDRAAHVAQAVARRRRVSRPRAGRCGGVPTLSLWRGLPERFSQDGEPR